MKDEMLFPEKIVAEKQICGKIKTNLEPEVVIAGTFDALDFKNMVLYE